MSTYFGFALADSMFSADCTIARRSVSIEIVADALSTALICLNPSHVSTIDAMRQRYGLNPPIPATPPQVSLGRGDELIVMGVRGLPRLTDRHEYTAEEVAKATFSFTLYTVL